MGPLKQCIKQIFKAQNQCKSTLDSAMSNCTDMYDKIYRLKSVNSSGNFKTLCFSTSK